ncbi:NB-ARC domain-containing protein [Sulfitobacter sp. TBRI5]|uniref:NB-ARC domain-containing protein n=1 Tax=Sulfitobacter sp. TBRI5 TaxID=2989732 RepID=UPI003D9AE1E8
MTIEDYSRAFALTNELIKNPKYWPTFSENQKRYSSDPSSIVDLSMHLFSNVGYSETFNNLPVPDYDDTGFFPRKKLEQELKKRIIGRHPVVTVLGDGGDGKTAVTLQTLYGLLNGNDHNFDAIIWVSAKSSKLTGAEIERIETEITSSAAAFGEVAGIFEEEVPEPLDRVLKLMEDNKILLVIDNLETILDENIQRFAADIPGESKLLLTSRIPLGSDLSVKVNPFTEDEAVSFLRVLISTYDIDTLKRESNRNLKAYASKMQNKPLLLKWFCLGVRKGLNPAAIVANSSTALKFCLENVFGALASTTRKHLSVLSTLPRASSLAVLQYVTEDDVRSLEESLAELMRFSIVEQKTDANDEVTFQVKPLAKSYLVRVLKEMPVNVETILKRFRQIEGIYQEESGKRMGVSRYNPNLYTVRSKSDAVAVRKLRQAIALAKNDNFLEAFEIIDDLKITLPDYFEVSRVEGYISFLSGNNSRAQEAYINAIELGQDQPQINLMYGEFLLRTYNDYQGALATFQKALEAAPEAPEVLIAVTKASMYVSDFEKAQSYLEKALKLENLESKTIRILYDLQIQNCFRRIEYMRSDSLPEDIAPYIRYFTKALSYISAEHLDETLIRRIREYSSNMARVTASFNQSVSDEVTQLEHQFNELMLLTESTKGDDESITRIGHLKESGRKPNFGFITSVDGKDTFVHRDDVDLDVWNAMLSGASVRHETERLIDGKTRAANVTLA